MTTPAKVTRQHRLRATGALAIGACDALFAFEIAGETCGSAILEMAAAVAQSYADLEAAAEARGEQRGRAAERAAVLAWLREHGGDVFLAEYRKDTGAYRPSLGEATDWGVGALAAAIGSGAHTGDAAEKHRLDDFQEGIAGGREMERTAVVAQLERFAATYESDSVQAGILRGVKRSIERGGHVSSR